MDIKWLKDKLFGRNAREEYEENYWEGGRILNVSCDDIRPNRAQPRADFNEDELGRLVSSVKEYGIIQPLIIKKTDADDIYEYELISGERRLRAARLAGLYSVPCIAFDADERATAELIILEDIMHSELNMFEIAYGLRNLCEDHGFSQEEVARRLWLTKSAVANKIKLLQLNYKEQRAVLALSLSERHALQLLRIDDHEQRMSVIYRIADGDMSVRDTERYVDKLLGGSARCSDEELLEDIDRASSSTIRAIRKQVEIFNKSGGEADIELESSQRALEMRIIFPK